MYEFILHPGPLSDDWCCIFRTGRHNAMESVCDAATRPATKLNGGDPNGLVASVRADSAHSSDLGP